MGIGGVSVGLSAELAQEPQHADAPPEATPQPGTKGFSMFFLLFLGKEIFVSFEQLPLQPSAFSPYLLTLNS